MSDNRQPPDALTAWLMILFWLAVWAVYMRCLFAWADLP
jgi:hypothetical protein